MKNQNRVRRKNKTSAQSKQTKIPVLITGDPLQFDETPKPEPKLWHLLSPTERLEMAAELEEEARIIRASAYRTTNFERN